MPKYVLVIVTFCLTFRSFGQSTMDVSDAGLTIDPHVKTEVEQKTSLVDFSSEQDEILFYNNLLLIDLFENDTLGISISEKDSVSSVFNSFYYWKGDTLFIDGAFGYFGGIGFSIKVVNGKSTLYHLLASDDFPALAYYEHDSLVLRLEVPCTETKIVLSENPSDILDQAIYGYVEYKSGDYYVSGGSVDGHEILPRKKQRANMRIYFKSNKLDLN